MREYIITVLIGFCLFGMGIAVGMGSGGCIERGAFEISVTVAASSNVVDVAVD